MNRYADKKQENKSRAVINQVSQKRRGGESSFLLVDNRPETIAQRKLQEVANNSLEVKQAAPLQAMANTQSTDQTPNIENQEGIEQPPIQKKDPIEETVLDKDKEGVKRDLNSAMKKIKAKIIQITDGTDELGKEAKKALGKSGRDWWVYAPVVSFWYSGMLGLLESWEETWTVEATSGLLLDIGIALRGAADKADEGGKSIMNEKMKATRTRSKKIDKTSDLVKDLPEGTEVSAGVSATTGNLLKTLRYLNVTTLIETEAIMNGIIMYWKSSKIKTAMGLFHTAAEVWSAYTFHLETYEKEKMKALAEK